MTICVVVARVEDGRAQYPIGGLGGASWYGVTSSSIDAAIQDKIQDSVLGWFSRANCASARGCDRALVYVRGDDGTYALREIAHP